MAAMKKMLSTVLLTVACGTVIGAASALLLQSLSAINDFRAHRLYTIFLLPLVGMLTALVYKKFGKDAHKGSNLIIQSVNERTEVPLRMSLLSFLFTLLTHFSGGSAGREGTAVQIGGSITNKAASWFHLTGKRRKLLILSGISAGFGSIFGTPLAGTFFGLEMCYVGRLEFEALFPCMLSSFTAFAVTQGLGIRHEVYRIQEFPAVTPQIIGIILLSACAFGITGKLYAIAVHKLKYLFGLLPFHYLLRALVAACIVLSVFLLLGGASYEGLSTWMIDSGFRGEVKPQDPFMKFILTSLTLGAGFQGGEVTPLFDIGASLGGLLGQIGGISPSLLAALGMISVFGSATNAPVTTIILGMELFGTQALPYYVVVAVISYYISGHSGIYSAQVIVTSKKLITRKHTGLRLDAVKSEKKSFHRKPFENSSK